VDAIRRLVRAAYARYVPRIGREPAPMTADYEELVAAGEVTVALEDDVIVGVLVLRPTGVALLVENVAVAPAAQGRGIGRALLAHAEAQARELGLGKVALYTNAKMAENLSFYPALGYVEVDRRSEHGFERVFFEKTLPSGGRARR
jgi:GNAT superfamily N-acetyltransferase